MAPNAPAVSAETSTVVVPETGAGAMGKMAGVDADMRVQAVRQRVGSAPAAPGNVRFVCRKLRASFKKAANIKKEKDNVSGWGCGRPPVRSILAALANAFCPAWKSTWSFVAVGPRFAILLLMTLARTAMSCDFKALKRKLVGAAGQKARSGGQGLPGAAVQREAHACR